MLVYFMSILTLTSTINKFLIKKTFKSDKTLPSVSGSENNFQLSLSRWKTYFSTLIKRIILNYVVRLSKSY